MPTSTTNFLRSGRLPRAGSNASLSQRAHSVSTSDAVAAASKAPGGLKTFINLSRFQPKLPDYRVPTIDLAADEGGKLLRRGRGEIDRRDALAERQCQNAPHLGVELGDD